MLATPAWYVHVIRFNQHVAPDEAKKPSGSAASLAVCPRLRGASMHHIYVYKQVRIRTCKGEEKNNSAKLQRSAMPSHAGS